MKKTMIIFLIFIIVVIFNIFSIIFVNKQTCNFIKQIEQMETNLNNKRNLNTIYSQAINLHKNWQSNENILKLFLKRENLNSVNKELIKLNFYCYKFNKNNIIKSLNLIKFYSSEILKDYNPSFSNIF